MYRVGFFGTLIWLLLCMACNTPESTTDALFSEKKSATTGISFQNKVENTDDFNIFSYRNFYNGGGVAIGDINNDGLKDIYFTANMGANKLYLNQGNWKFKDITETAGVGLNNKWSTGVVMIDINHDNYLDLYVCNAGYLKGQDQKNVLFINNGDNTFTDQAEAFGLDENGYTTHAAFLDYDQDGDLDVYLLNNSFIPTNTLNYSNKRDLPASEWPVKDFLKGGGDKFLRNDGGKFVDVSAEAGIYQSLIGFGLGVTVGDINDDNYDDLYISNDFFEKDYLYINQKDGTFKEQLEDYFQHISHSSMGADMRDINNDGLTDLFVTDMMPDNDYRLKTNASFDDINLRRLKVDKGFYHQYMHNTLQLNAGNRFKEISFHAGVAGSDWSWGALMFDADNDRFTDLFVCNGIYHDVIDLDFMDFFANEVMQKMAISGKKEEMQSVVSQMPSNPIPNKMFRNLDGYGFEDYSDHWGLDKATFSNGAAYGDLDNDGDPDLVINNVNMPALVYENNTTNTSIVLRLEGKAPNTNCIGAKVYVHSSEGIQFQQINPSRGFQSSVPTDVMFGLGEETQIDSIVIKWPKGDSRLIVPEAGDSLLVIKENESENRPGKSRERNTRMFSLNTELFDAHREDDYVDYYNERGIYRMLSKEGPAACVGDLNGDGRDDVFISGATGQASEVYLQQANGFRKTIQPDLDAYAKAEDVAASFFDADGDGDLDLLVGAGGNHVPPNSPIMLDRFYLNDGKGNFTLDSGFQPGISMNTSVILPIDYDGDNDLDLFIGSRCVPQHFAFSPVHFLFENDGKGKFTEVSKEVFNYFKGVGMVTDAAWTDVTGDNQEELILVSDWEYPRVFEYKADRFEEIATDLQQYSGWFYTIEVADLDKDGDDDLILGNHGTNNYLKASEEAPLHLWMNDFDGNQYVDKVLTYGADDKDVPVLLKKDLADQINSIKKAGIKHAEYAQKTFQELLPAEAFEKAKKKTFNYMHSAIAWNEGYGEFSMQALPLEAQFSCIKAILPVDVDGDGDLDLITGGNEYNLLPQFSRMDASFGSVLLNDGEGHFSFLPEIESGLYVDGEVKHILPLTLNNSTGYLFIINNSAPVFIQKNTDENS